jgi:hypothetical protein
MKMPRKTRNLLIAKLKRALIKCFEEFKKQNDCQQFYFITPRFSDTLKTKVGDVVGCILEVECSVGGFLILKQIKLAFSLQNLILHFFTLLPSVVLLGL